MLEQLLVSLLHIIWCYLIGLNSLLIVIALPVVRHIVNSTIRAENNLVRILILVNQILIELVVAIIIATSLIIS